MWCPFYIQGKNELTFIHVCFILALAANNKCQWNADKQWYHPVNTTIQYHITQKTTEYSSCSTECVQVERNASFATMNETLLQQFRLVKILRSVLLWVVHSAHSTPSACNFVLKGELLLSNDCRHRFRCLCQRQTNSLANATRIIPDTKMSINRSMHFHFYFEKNVSMNKFQNWFVIFNSSVLQISKK